MSTQQQNLNSYQEIYKKISKFVPENEWKVHAPLIEKIHKLKKMRTWTIPINFLVAAIMQGISSQSINAQPSRPDQIPLKITVKKVKITDKDIDQAAKFCLVKEGSLKIGSTINERPTPAQKVVMATMCP